MVTLRHLLQVMLNKHHVHSTPPPKKKNITMNRFADKLTFFLLLLCSSLCSLLLLLSSCLLLRLFTVTCNTKPSITTHHTMPHTSTYFNTTWLYIPHVINRRTSFPQVTHACKSFYLLTEPVFLKLHTTYIIYYLVSKGGCRVILFCLIYTAD